MDIKIIFNEKENEAQAFDDDKKIGFLQYEEEENIWKATHTVVDKAYGGKGVAGKLLDEFVKNAKANDKKILPICSYVVKKFDEDDKYKDIDAR